jgi:hypothetical protein
LSKDAQNLTGLFRQSHENVAVSESLLIEPEPFAQHAPHAIAIDGSRDNASRDDQAEAWAPERIGAGLHRHASAPQAFAGRKQRVDVFAA